MLIDWFTVSAQLVNFLILVWLLKRFLYRPILDALDAREKRIAKELADAAAKQAEADRERDEFQQRNKAFDEQRDGLLAEAKEKAETERKRLFDEAQRDIEALRAKQLAELNRERQSLDDDITRRARQEVFALTRKALADLAGTTLEERMAEVFTARLQELEGDAKEALVNALKTTSEPVLVRSAFDLPQAQQDALRNALNIAFSAEVPVRFETAPDLVSGVELAANGQKVAWSVADHLASLEKTVDELLKEPPKAPAKPKPEPAAAAPEEAK
jgi:F-type H+-transporting ATPase subunit b